MSHRTSLAAIKCLTVVIPLLALAACAAGKTIVEQPSQKASFTAAHVVEEQSNVAVPSEVATAFKTSLGKKLYDAGKFTPGDNGLVVKYHFVQYAAGSRAERWLTGGIGNAGESSTMVKVNFQTPNGAQLGAIEVEGHIGSGFFGGSTDDALDKATDQIVAYAVANFH
jgi:hypothetical protein